GSPSSFQPAPITPRAPTASRLPRIVRTRPSTSSTGMLPKPRKTGGGPASSQASRSFESPDSPMLSRSFGDIVRAPTDRAPVGQSAGVGATAGLYASTAPPRRALADVPHHVPNAVK